MIPSGQRLWCGLGKARLAGSRTLASDREGEISPCNPSGVLVARLIIKLTHDINRRKINTF